MLHIYKASAGSGKTYTLTKQYLMLMLGDRDPVTGKWTLKKAPDRANRHILAITFTNKATEEMIRRIIHQLALLGGREKGKCPYTNDLMKTFGVDRETLQRLASAVLDELLADFLFFNVSTIDSFFQNVLRIFAREIEMPDNFELQLENKYAISVGVSEMFRALNARYESDPIRRKEQAWLQNWFHDYTANKFATGDPLNLLSREGNLYSELVGTFNRLFDETFKIHSREIIEYLSDLNRLIAFENGLRDEVAAMETHLTKVVTAIRSYEAYPLVNTNLRSRIALWHSSKDLKLDTKFPETVTKGCTLEKSRFKSDYFKRKERYPDLDQLVTDFCVTYCDLFRLQHRNRQIYRALVPMGLLGLLLKYLDRYCKDNNMIMLSETNNLLSDIINRDDTPFVYERLGYYLNHFLIDEFQDTSRMQWQNIRPLILESLSLNHEDLIIGDEKQCIYRFRNSDPELLGKQVQQDIERVFSDELVSVEGNTIDQNNNWRSAREVVTFNNSIFLALAKLLDNNGSYSNVIQQISPMRKEIPGHSRLIFLPEPPAKDKKSPDYEEDADTEKLPAQNLDVLCDEVYRMLKSGYRPADICVLVSTHREGNIVINRLLEQAKTPEWEPLGVEVTSNDSITLADSPAVRMVIEILRLTQIPQMVKTYKKDDLGTVTVSEYESEAYQRTRLRYCYEYCLNTEQDFPDGRRCPTSSEALVTAIKWMKLRVERVDRGVYRLSDKDIPDDLPEIPDTVRQVLELNMENLFSGSTQVSGNEAPSTTLSTIVDTVIKRFIQPRTIEQESIYLAALQDLVYDFCERGNSDIRAFLEYWDRGASKTAVIAADSSQAITVMTIHASKGLEFPCVIVPSADWKLCEYSSSYKRRTDWFSLNPADFPTVHPDLVPPMIPMEFVAKLSDYEMFAPQATKIVDEQHIDRLNLAYVAFTRAVNELTIITQGGKDEMLGNYLREAVDMLTADNLADPDFVAEDSAPWTLPLRTLKSEDENGIVTVDVGTPTSPAPEEEDCDEADEEILDYPLPAYNPDVKTHLATLTRLDAKFFDFTRANHRGDFLHYIMSKVYRLDDLPKAAKRAFYRAHLNPLQARHCVDILQNAIDDPRVLPWFDGFENVIIERPLQDSGRIRRPDRVVFTADGHIDIVDYKFSEKNHSLADIFAHASDLQAMVEELPGADERYASGLDLTGAIPKGDFGKLPELTSIFPEEEEDNAAASARLLREYVKQLRDYAAMLREGGYDHRRLRAYLWYVPARRILRVKL